MSITMTVMHSTPENEDARGASWGRLPGRLTVDGGRLSQKGLSKVWRLWILVSEPGHLHVANSPSP